MWLWMVAVWGLTVTPGIGVDAQLKELERQVIAPCCFTTPLNEHFSDPAVELKRQLREWLAQGLSMEAIEAQLVARYGERILAKPRRSGFNLLVWWVPPLIFLLVLFLVVRYLLRQQRQSALSSGADDNALAPDDESRNKKIEEQLQQLGRMG